MLDFLRSFWPYIVAVTDVLLAIGVTLDAVLRKRPGLDEFVEFMQLLRQLHNRLFKLDDSFAFLCDHGSGSVAHKILVTEFTIGPG